MPHNRIEDARKGARQVQDAVSGGLGDGEAQLRDTLNEAVSSVQDAYGRARDQADTALGEAQGRAEAVYGELQDYIREKPLLAVGLGALAGVLLWHMLGANRKVIYVRK
ncbi:MAG TPA: hypothetical protein VL358_11640 [Caulobacteraceae bacterium]|nr:hypothetical protein [Caulobacteraceae bacterium]